MHSPIIIGLEAHDGSGKSSTAKEIQKLFGGRIWTVADEMKERRRNISNLSGEELMEKMDETYVEESAQIHKMISSEKYQFAIMDRTWASHAAERHYEESSAGETISYASKEWPEKILQPNITFQIIVPENERRARVEKRGEKLTQRDIDLNEKPEYRAGLEKARKELGCIALRLRLRDPKVCALRAAQVILGSKDCPPTRITLPQHSL